MLVPTSPAPHPAAPVLPLDGMQLVADDRLVKVPLTRRAEVVTSRGPVLLRPVVPTDLAGIDRFVRRLSPASRFARFHSGLHHLSTRQLAGMVDVDHHERETILALDGRTVVGVSQLLLVSGLAEVELAEVELAVVVSDGWQRQGIGRALLECLAAVAAGTGAAVASALVQADNRPVLHLLRQLGERAELHHDGSTVEARIRL